MALTLPETVAVPSDVLAERKVTVPVGEIFEEIFEAEIEAFSIAIWPTVMDDTFVVSVVVVVTGVIVSVAAAGLMVGAEKLLSPL
jgi:hypothetical protein